MLHNAHKMGEKSFENQTKRQHANYIEINTMSASTPPPFLLPKINSSEGILVKHQKDLYGRSTRKYGLWFNYKRQEYVLTLYN